MEENGKETKPAKQKRDKPLSSLDRVILQAMGEGKTVGNPDDPAREKWPQLWEWLSRIYVGVDKIKQPANIFIALGPGGVVARLSDRDLSYSVAVGTANLVDVFDALEVELAKPQSNSGSWGKKDPNIRKRKSSS
jgi:hypothetical protein